jgi:hypothetical protein
MTIKIAHTDVNLDSIYENQSSLSDTIRMALYQVDSGLFEKLNYEDDVTFLEPTLFCYFLSDIAKQQLITLEQCLLGYVSKEVNLLEPILVKADQFGLANLPNIGYIHTLPNQTLRLSKNEILAQLIPNTYVTDSSIRLCWHPTDLLAHQANISFDEPIEQTQQKNQLSLAEAVTFFRAHTPDFWRLIETVVRELVVFSSPPNHHSFAGIRQHGTAYFNVENKPQTAVFFIDDMAHQCGHVIFNALTLDTAKYLRVDKEHPLKDFTKKSWEIRSVYGAFHGLFTYTTILHSLDKVLDAEAAFSVAARHEALGRIGFYHQKFGIDLVSMDNSNILTEEGMAWHKQFAAGYMYICQKYQHVLASYRYTNQPYTFQYDLFSALNPNFKLASV